MKKLLLGMLLLLFSLTTYSQTPAQEPKSTERYFLIAIEFKTLNGVGMGYWTESGPHFPNKKDIEKTAQDEFKIQDEPVILNIMEFKSKQDWKDFNYATWETK